MEIAESGSARTMPNREQFLEELSSLQQEEKQLDSDLAALKYNDPAEVKKIKVATEKMKEAADRWTDNLWVVKSFLTKKKGMPTKEVRDWIHIIRVHCD